MSGDPSLDLTAFTGDQFEALLVQLEAALVEAEGSDDPMAVRIREHVQPFVDFYRGHRSIRSDELDRHSDEVMKILTELGAAASAVLDRLSDALTEGIQRSRRSQFGGDDLEGQA